jgi:integrase
MSKRKRRKKTITECGIPIREKRPGYWQVDFRRDGKHARACAVKVKTEGTNFFALTTQQRTDAAKAIELLGGHATLVRAAEEYIRRYPPNDCITLSGTAWGYLRYMVRAGRRTLSIKDKRWKCRKICADLGDRTTASLDEKEVESWLTSKGFTGKTRKNYRRAFINLLNYHAGALRKKTGGDEQPPQVFTVEIVRELFAHAEKKYPEMVAALTALFFCGLRPYEAERLTWQNIDLAQKFVRLDGNITKTRSTRIVDIPDNALAFFAKYASKGNVSPGHYKFRNRREELMKLAGVERWPVDVSRHTYATAHYKAHNDAAKTAAQLGHFEGLSTFTKHYKSLMTPGDASKYWQIRPSKKRGMIQFKGAA